MGLLSEMQVIKMRLQQVSILKKLFYISEKSQVDPGYSGSNDVKWVCPSPSLGSAFQSFKKHLLREFSGGPVVRTPRFHC